MSRIRILTVALLVLLGAALATAGRAAADEGAVYQRYADIRERLYACHLETAWKTQTAARRADCRRLARDYVLYGSPGEGFVLHVHCRSPQRCIATPSSEPAADAPYPDGATIYEIATSRQSAHRKRKRAHPTARAGRSRTARAAAAAAR